MKPEENAPRTLLDLSSIEAKEFLLKEERYRNFDLPEYFKFQFLLKKLDEKKDLCNIDGIKEVKQPNYNILTNKDGKYAWRNFELIHPVIYISLVQQIEKSWEKITNRFKGFQENEKIQCYSIPVVPNEGEKQKAAQVGKWWKKIEQQSISLALKYRYMMKTDITNFYGSIYTHSVPWAIHGKKFAKKIKIIKNLLEI
ncbi:MAG: hypothetical protein V6Z82_02590 [Flavobacteriales bacterium]